jgi:hypothetical protein
LRHTLLIALLLPLLAHTQSWAPIGAKWTYTVGSSVSPDSFILVIEAASDTVIAGRPCRQLDVLSGGFGCYVFNRFHHQSNDSLYFWDEPAEAFRLLFRWNAVPGDTWSIPLELEGLGADGRDTLDWSVLDTSTVDVEGLQSRQFSVNMTSRNGIWQPSIGTIVTERLGPLASPFVWKFEICDGEYYAGLRCYEDNDIAWQSPDVPQCALGTGITEAGASPPFIMSPNPVLAGEPTYIELIGTAAPTDMHVYDALGREVLQSRLMEARTPLTLPVRGMYVINLRRAGVPAAQQRLLVR